ncbi:MAG TPA: tetratricopeptide repeat protein [Kofleriaceae bacterium]|nr:tetratricopeptide repeat protein [Kofleriaceae bacterium]
MSSRFAALLLGLALVACGGGKKGKTTPDTNKTGSGDSQSMNDKGEPGGPGTGSAGGPGGPGGTGGTGDTGGTGAGSSDGPPVVPPNLDPDPAQAKTQVDAHLVIAKNALSQANPDADTALREARAALAIDAANIEAASYVAFAYYHKKLYDTAELVLDDLFRREAAKQNANVYYVYGLVYDKTNRPEKARVAYQKAVELDGKHASALVNLGVHQLKNSQYAEAQQTFERLTKEFGRNDAITLTSLGSSYRGRSAEYPQGAAERDQFVRTAEAAYKRALAANPNYGPAYYNLGLLYLDTSPYPGITDELQRLNAAKSYFDQYKNMPGVDIKLYDQRMKDVDKAIKREQKKQKKNSKTNAKTPAPKNP